MRAVPVDIEEVNDLTSQHTIRDVAERPAKNEAVPERFEARQRLPQLPDEPNRDQQAKRDEKVALPAARCGQKAERSARIEHMHKVEERGDLGLLAIAERSDDAELGGLIGGK